SNLRHQPRTGQDFSNKLSPSGYLPPKICINSVSQILRPRFSRSPQKHNQRSLRQRHACCSRARRRRVAAEKDKTMRRRSILKWIALTAISLTAVFKLSILVNNQTAAATMKRAQASNEGTLQALDKDGHPAGECPLKHTDVKAEVSGFLSRVTVTQDFVNNFPNKIEAVYTFPLPESAAVDDLTMQIGDRIIKGKIMRRQEAKATYAAAKQAGQIATILNQQKPNLFRQGVANILPGQSIRISLSYVETLKYEDGAYEWSFPMVVGERATPGSEQQQDSGAAPVASSRVPDGMRPGRDVSIEVALDAGVPIVAVNSETHET